MPPQRHDDILHRGWKCWGECPGHPPSMVASCDSRDRETWGGVNFRGEVILQDDEFLAIIKSRREVGCICCFCCEVTSYFFYFLIELWKFLKNISCSPMKLVASTWLILTFRKYFLFFYFCFIPLPFSNSAGTHVQGVIVFEVFLVDNFESFSFGFVSWASLLPYGSLGSGWFLFCLFAHSSSLLLNFGLC